jgi:uncharacterized protein involved in tolerance to divalent cations
MPKTLVLTIPDSEVVPEVVSSFSPEENFLMLKIGSECLREGRNAVVGLSQKEIYRKIKDESKEEVKKLELDLVVEREMAKQMEEKISKIYEGQVEQLKKQMEMMRQQIDSSRQQLKIYESENKELVEKEVNKAKEKFQLLLEEKDKQNQLNREVFDKAVNLINKNSAKTSSAIGDDGENIFENFASETFKDFVGYRIENKAKQAHKGDFHLFFEDFNILVDSKNYSGSVQKKEVIKIEEDLMINDNMKFAWMVSLNSNICEYNRYPISIKWITTEVGVKCILFINNLLENKDPKNILRQAWCMCNEFYKLTKSVYKEDGELTKHREKELVIKKQIENLQERASEIRRSLNASFNVLKNMDNDLIEMLSLVSNEIMKNKFSLNSKIGEWWDSNLEYVKNENKLTSTEIWHKFKRENKEYVSENKITIDVFKDAVTNIVDSSTYTEKTKKGAVEFTGFIFKHNELENIVVEKKEQLKLPKKIKTEKHNEDENDVVEKKEPLKFPKKIKTEKLKEFIFDEETDYKILKEYDDAKNDIMTISSTNNIKPWQVVSILMRSSTIKKRPLWYDLH